MAIRKPVEWTTDEARRHLHALLREAAGHDPQPVERSDGAEIVVVSVGTWRNPGNLADFFLNSPLRDSGIELERHPDTLEDVDEWMRRRGTFDEIDRLADDFQDEDVDSH